MEFKQFCAQIPFLHCQIIKFPANAICAIQVQITESDNNNNNNENENEEQPQQKRKQFKTRLQFIFFIELTPFDWQIPVAIPESSLSMCVRVCVSLCMCMNMREWAINTAIEYHIAIEVTWWLTAFHVCNVTSKDTL